MPFSRSAILVWKAGTTHSLDRNAPSNGRTALVKRYHSVLARLSIMIDVPSRCIEQLEPTTSNRECVWPSTAMRSSTSAKSGANGRRKGADTEARRAVVGTRLRLRPEHFLPRNVHGSALKSPEPDRMQSTVEFRVMAAHRNGRLPDRILLRMADRWDEERAWRFWGSP